MGAAVLRELKAANAAAGERMEMRRIVSLRQSFIVLNTSTVVQDGATRWQFGSVPARRNCSSTPLPKIGSPASTVVHNESEAMNRSSGVSTVDRLYKAAESSPLAGSPEVRAGRHAKGKKGLQQATKALRHRLQRSEASLVAAQRRYDELDDRWQQTRARLEQREEALSTCKARLTSALSEAAGLRETLSQHDAEVRGAEALGREEVCRCWHV